MRNQSQATFCDWFKELYINLKLSITDGILEWLINRLSYKYQMRLEMFQKIQSGHSSRIVDKKI
jgi:hypothetical protein